jgi:transcriptional regulator with XRE-family HTH domain
LKSPPPRDNFNAMSLSPSAPADSFPRQLRYWRRRRRLTQRALAERCGYSQSAVSLLEAGIREPFVRTVRRLAAALRVPVSRLLGDEGP